VLAILARLQQNPANFESRSYADNLDALAFLARNDKDRSAVRSFLVTQLNHPKPDVRYGAAKALGTLKDPATIAVLEPLALVAKPYVDPFREAVAKSLESLQANLDAPDEAKTIWQRLDELQRKDAELRKQLDDLKKQKAAKQ
jgi:aminopeptidase N